MTHRLARPALRRRPSPPTPPGSPFSGAYAIAFTAAPPASVVRPARRLAAMGLLAMAATGSMLFAAEAMQVATNPVFPIKVALIVLGILNALRAGRLLREALDQAQAFEPLPTAARLCAVLR